MGREAQPDEQDGLFVLETERKERVWLKQKMVSSR